MLPRSFSKQAWHASGLRIVRQPAQPVEMATGLILIKTMRCAPAMVGAESHQAKGRRVLS